MTKPMSAKQKRRKKQLKRRRRVLLVLLITLIVISICLFTPFFNIQNTVVIGNENISAEQIIQVASIPPQHNIFRLNKKSIKKAIMSIPEIENVKISRKLPSTVQISVTETMPFMYFPFETGYAITNQQGRVLALTDSNENLDLLYITGLEIKNAEICKKISVQDTITFDIILSIMEKFHNVGLQPDIKSCHFDSIADFYIYLKDGTKVLFGKTTDMDYKISVLLNILPKTNREEGAYIDLTTPSRAISGMIEPTPMPSPSPEPQEETEVSPTPQAEASTSPQPAGTEVPTGTVASSRQQAL